LLLPLRRIIAALTLCLAATAAGAESTERLEYGLGLAAMALPHYPGSDQSHEAVLPFPFLTYAGPRLEIDRNEVRGRLYSSDNFSLDISTGGNLPVRSRDNRAREGMPDLDWLGELGPALRYVWAGSDPYPWRLAAEWPLRRAASADGLQFRSRGWTSEPNLDLSREWATGAARWRFEARVNVLFASTAYNQYYYGVPDTHVTEDRAAFRAEGGFNGLRTSLGLSYRRDHLWIGGFLRHTDLSRGEVADSPLTRSERSVSGGIALARIIGSRRSTLDPT
jgi:MipA family protein